MLSHLPLADFIEKHETLRKVVRRSLLPFVAMTYVMLHLGAETSLLSLATFLTISAPHTDSHKKKTGMPFCCVLDLLPFLIGLFSLPFSTDSYYPFTHLELLLVLTSLVGYPS